MPTRTTLPVVRTHRISAITAVGAAVAFLTLLPNCGGRNRDGSSLPDPESTMAREGEQVEEWPGAAQERREEPILPAKPGAGVALRLKRNVGKVQVYEAKFDRKQLGRNRYTETGKFYLTYFTNDRTPEGYDRVSIRRTFLDRARKETYENKKTVDRILPMTDTLLDLGPNFEWVAQQRCYAFDAQNRVAYRSEDLIQMRDGTQKRGIIVKRDADSLVLETTNGREMIAQARVARAERIPTPHVLKYDTAHYLFPILSAREVQTGQTWRFRVPVIIPLEQGGQRAVLPTQFQMAMTGRLSEVRNRGGSTIAVVDYNLAGHFDTSKAPYTQRFSKAFRDRNRIIHEFTGKGWIRLNVERGVIVEKQEDIQVKLYGASLVRQPNNKPPKKEETEATITSSFNMRWLPPGTRLRSGAVVPGDR